LRKPDPNHRHDVRAVVGQSFQGKRLAGPEPESTFGEMRADIGNSFNREITHQRRRAFGDLKVT